MESRRIEKVCDGCVLGGKCKRFPDWHEDTERYDCADYQKRTADDVREEIEEIREKQFLNSMNDHWTADDYTFDRKCSERIRKLESELERLEEQEC